MTAELRNLTVRKISLVRKGFRPVNDGATITVVKAEQEPTPVSEQAKPSVAERLLKAIQDVLGGEKPAEPTAEPSAEEIAKAQTAKQVIADDGTHGDMNGVHKHTHSHSGSDGKVYEHSHEHSHSGESHHFHQYESAGHGTDASAMCKAEAADAAIDAKVTKLIDKVDALVQDLKAAQEKDNEISKALLDEAKVKEIAAAAVTEALEPIAKGIEDLKIDRARAPITPNAQLADPTKPTPPKSASDLKGMSYSDAIRTLLHG